METFHLEGEERAHSTPSVVRHYDYNKVYCPQNFQNHTFISTIRMKREKGVRAFDEPRYL